VIEVFLAGEGRNELGGWCIERSFRDDDPDVGVLEALARQVVASGWRVRDAIRWKDIPKLRVGTKGKGAERQAVLAAHLHAKERGCTALLFSRDRDGSKNAAREREIEQAMAELEAGDGAVVVAGGVCVERLESWLLAVSGRTQSEDLGRSKVDEELAALGVPSKDTARMLELVERHGSTAVAPDATSLRRWIERVKTALASPPVE
jgi:hypothetical protein